MKISAFLKKTSKVNGRAEQSPRKPRESHFTNSHCEEIFPAWIRTTNQTMQMVELTKQRCLYLSHVFLKLREKGRTSHFLCLQICSILKQGHETKLTSFVEMIL